MGNFISDFFENKGWLRIPQVTLSGGTPVGIEFLGTPILGTAGDKAGIIYQWSTDVTNTTPGVGGIKANSATIGSITTLRISDVELNASVDVQAIYGQWALNDTITILSNSSTGNKISRFTINGTPSSTPTGWWDIPVTSGVGTLPSNLEEVAVQHSKAGVGSGVDGDKGGFKYTFNTTVEANQVTTPGNGFCRMNNATPASVTQISFSTTDADSLALAAFLATWQVGGRIRIKSNTMADGSFHIFDITAIQDNSTWFRFTGTTVACAAFTNNEAMAVDYFDSSEAPTYTSLDDASLPAAASNTDLIVSLSKIKSANTTGKRALAVSNGTTYQPLYRCCFYDDRTDKTFVAVNSAITWSVSNSGGFCLFTASGVHGLGIVATYDGANIQVISAPTVWAANTSCVITDLPSTTTILTSTPIGSYAGTAPVVASLSVDILMATLPIPPALATSQFNIYPTYSMTSNTNATKNFAIKIGTTYAGSTDLFRTTSGLASSATNSTDFCFYNKNATNSQETRGAEGNVTQFGNMAAHKGASIQTSGGSANLYIVGTSGTVTDIIGYRSIFAEMTA